MALTDHDDLGDDLDAYLAGERENSDGLLAVAADGDPDAHLLAAERMVRAIARHRRRVAAAEALAVARIAEVEEWVVRQRQLHSTEWLEEQLAAYHEARLLDDPRAKTISLPSGALKARKTPDQWNVEDPAAVLSWAQEVRPELVRTKLELDRNELKRRLTPTGDGAAVDPESGEVAPGVSVAPGEVRFSVEIVGEA